MVIAPELMSTTERASWEALFTAARTARQQSHAPFSRFRVGAALITGTGRIFTGANYESASYGLTLCAERAAVLAAQAEGQVPELTALALAADGEWGSGLADTDEPVWPCGACRQWLFEVTLRTGRDLVVMGGSSDFSRVWKTSARALLPAAFG